MPISRPTVAAPMTRGLFEFAVTGEDETRVLCMAGSEWLLFQHLRRLSKSGAEIAWFENYGAPLTPRSLGALNAYLRSGAIRRWQSKRWDEERELIGGPEWRRFVKMLSLKFDGRHTRAA